jgi:hypothetical protein
MGKLVYAKMKNVFPPLIFFFDVGGLNGMGNIVMIYGNLSR